MSLYYISYLDKAEQSGNFPHDIQMGSFDNFDIAENYFLERFHSIYGEDEYKIVRLWRPILITNDGRLDLLYKNIISGADFRIFCNIYDKYDSLSHIDKYVAQSGLRGEYGIQAYEHFQKLVTGEAKMAYQYTKKDTWTEEDTGNTYEYEEDWGWRTRTSYYMNEEIKKKYRL